MPRNSASDRGRGARLLFMASIGAACLGGMALMAAFAVSLFAAAVDNVQVTPLARDGRIVVSFEMKDGVSDEVRASIKSGLPTALTYNVDLRRNEPLWLDRTIESVSVMVSVKYDTLTRRYQVSRSRDSRIEDAFVTEDENQVYRAMTLVDRSP